MNDNEEKDLAPRKRASLFPVTAEDIVDNALHNLDEKQAADVTRKAADEIVRIAVQKRTAEYKNAAAQEEMSNLINNADMLDRSVSNYQINSTFETASGTTSVEIKKNPFSPANIIIAAAAIVVILLIFFFLFFRA
jgi:hypothetical protein